MAVQTQEKTQKSSINKSMYVHTAIGLGIMFLFPQLPPFEPITPLGMWIAAVFLGMIYLWSTVSATWPSILGLIVIGLTGIAGPGYKGMSGVFLNSFGMDTVIITLLSMVLFGAVEHYGCSQYIARWFLTRKIINGRPYAFMAVFFACCYTLSALTSPITSLFILWAIAVDVLEILKVEKTDKLYPILIAGTFFASTVGQPTLPFKGAELIIVSAYQKLSGQMVNFAAYIVFAVIMSTLIIVGYLLLVKFFFRTDVSKLKNINVEQFNASPLPPMNMRQKIYLIMIPIYITAILIPIFLPVTNPVVNFFASLNVLGITALTCVVLCAIQANDGKPILQFREVASRQVSWDVFFLIAAAVYAANALSIEATGINKWMIQTLTPVFQGQSEWMFAFLLLLIAMILTNFANNAAMAVVLMPIIIAFCDLRGIDSMPFAMGVLFMVFIAMLTPSASPHAGMMHGRKDLISTKDIIRIGFPACIMALVLYTFIGYPLSKFIF